MLRAERFERLSINICKAYPTYLFVFGDNDLGVGTGGTACIRYCSNSHGISTKKAPGVRPEDYYSDVELFRHINNWTEDFDYLNYALEAKKYDKVIFPKGPLGYGLALLHEKAPQSFQVLTIMTNGFIRNANS